MSWFGKLFVDSKNKNVQIDTIRNTDSHVVESIMSYLELKTTGALLITGEWGSGKTHYMKTIAFPHVEKNTKYLPLIVSLYGETDKYNIIRKVLFSYLEKGKNVEFMAKTLGKNAKYISEAIPGLNKIINIEKLLMGDSDNFINMLPQEKILVCFDDLERMSEKT